ncbi:phage tail tape measure protein [Enterobacter hormaechei]
MSNNVRIEVLLNAVDRASRPLKAIQNASKSLAGDIRTSQNSLRDLNAQAGRIDGFRKASAQLAVTGQSLNRAKQEAAALAVQFKNTLNPTTAQARAMEAAKKSAAELQLKYNSLRQSVQRQRTELARAGINTRTLSADERRLKTSISETTAQLNRQRGALARVSQQQARLSRIKERYQAGKSIAGGAAAAGAAGVGTATAGTMAGVKLLTPGYDFAQKNSELQAVLGGEKQSPEMEALRKQARQLGDNTAASADDAASAQIIIAKSGGDAAAIQAATPVTLNMALSNRRSMFGKMLAEALMLPLKSFNTLGTGVNWLLEKLGVIKKESGELDQTAAKANAATGSQKGSYIPATSAYGGYQAYQPVTAPTGKTYVDQSKPEYNINLNGGIAPGSDLDRQLREAVDKLDRENRARQRSSMRHD